MCFSVEGVAAFLIWLVVLCAVIGILRVLVPWILSLAGIAVGGPVMTIINIVIVAIVIVAVIKLCLVLWECSGGIGLRLH